jgi:hypothetical protein
MSVDNFIALISAAIAAAALILTYLKYRDDKLRKASERERLAHQAERLTTATRAAWDARHAADLLIQRAKVPGVAVEEIQNIGRIIRGNLESLAKQLEDDANDVQYWRDPTAYASRSEVTSPEKSEAN